MLSLLFFEPADVNVTASGVAANAAIGTGTIDVTFALTGIAANAAIGASRIAIDFAASGVSASAAVGAGSINVDFALTGVAANSAIGNGTLTGAADVTTQIQSFGIQVGTANLFGGGSRRGARGQGPSVRARTVSINAGGAVANPRIGRGIVMAFSATRSATRIVKKPAPKPVQVKAHGAAAHAKIGNCEIVSVIDLTEEEILFLLAA